MVHIMYVSGENIQSILPRVNIPPLSTAVVHSFRHHCHAASAAALGAFSTTVVKLETNINHQTPLQEICLSFYLLGLTAVFFQHPILFCFLLSFIKSVFTCVRK